MHDLLIILATVALFFWPAVIAVPLFHFTRPNPPVPSGDDSPWS